MVYVSFFLVLFCRSRYGSRTGGRSTSELSLKKKGKKNPRRKAHIMSIDGGWKHSNLSKKGRGIETVKKKKLTFRDKDEIFAKTILTLA